MEGFETRQAQGHATSVTTNFRPLLFLSCATVSAPSGGRFDREVLISGREYDGSHSFRGAGVWVLETFGMRLGGCLFVSGPLRK